LELGHLKLDSILVTKGEKTTEVIEGKIAVLVKYDYLLERVIIQN